MNQNWISIRGFEGFYEINADGIIRSWSFGKNRKRSNPFVLKWRKSKDGYAKVILSKNSGEAVIGFLVHRLVAMTFLTNPLGLAEVNHKDGNKMNNCVDNLEWVSRTENMRHAFKNNLNVSKRGHLARHAKLNLKQIADIKAQLSEPNANGAKIAKAFGISATHVYRIKNGVHWKPISPSSVL